MKMPNSLDELDKLFDRLYDEIIKREAWAVYFLAGSGLLFLLIALNLMR